MALSKAHKMLLLFVSPENPIWEKLLSEKPRAKDVLRVVGRSAQRLSQFRNGDPVSPGAANAIFNYALKFVGEKATPEKADVVKRIQQYQKAYNDGGATMYKMASILGMKPQEAQVILDRLIYEHLPLFPKMYEATKGEAQQRAHETVRRYGGVYRCSLIRGDEILVCALRVRYELKLAAGYGIRCKLNVPRSSIWRDDEGISYWEYDGFMARRERTIFWTFEKREEHRSDYLSLITGADHAHGKDLKLTGHYLTTGQEKEPSIVNGEAYLERQVAPSFQKIEATMHNSPCIISGAAAMAEIHRLRGGG